MCQHGFINRDKCITLTKDIINRQNRQRVFGEVAILSLHFLGRSKKCSEIKTQGDNYFKMLNAFSSFITIDG